MLKKLIKNYYCHDQQGKGFHWPTVCYTSSTLNEHRLNVFFLGQGGGGPRVGPVDYWSDPVNPRNPSV